MLALRGGPEVSKVRYLSARIGIRGINLDPGVLLRFYFTEPAHNGHPDGTHFRRLKLLFSLYYGLLKIDLIQILLC